MITELNRQEIGNLGNYYWVPWAERGRQQQSCLAKDNFSPASVSSSCLPAPQLPQMALLLVSLSARLLKDTFWGIHKEPSVYPSRRPGHCRAESPWPCRQVGHIDGISFMSKKTWRVGSGQLRSECRWRFLFLASMKSKVLCFSLYCDRNLLQSNFQKCTNRKYYIIKEMAEEPSLEKSGTSLASEASGI